MKTYCDGSITNMWSLNGFNNDLPLLCRFCQKSESDLYIFRKCTTFIWC